MTSKLKLTRGTSQIKQTLFADVLVPVPVMNDFTYRVPENMMEDVETGKRVAVPFGRNRILTGIIRNIHNKAPEAYTAKYILDILDDQPAVHEKNLKFWNWIADYYISTPGEVMEAALPASMKLESHTIIALHPSNKDKITNANLQDHNDLQITPVEFDILLIMQSGNEIMLNDLIKHTGKKNLMPVIKRLVEKEYLIVKQELQESYKPKLVKTVDLNPDIDDPSHLKEILDELEKAPKQADLLLMLLSLRKKQNRITISELLKKSGTSRNILNALRDKAIIHISEIEEDRVPAFTGKKHLPVLNKDQKKAFNDIQKQFENHPAVLLHGVTGSGKTYIYIHWIKKLIEQEKQVLYLVPEIGLSTQLISRLKEYFGNDIGVYHSRFNNLERYELWQKVRHGKLKIILGVRSALFLPFQNLGGVVIDEEHETTFKQFDRSPRYNARDAAVYLASQLFKGKVLLGTATPSFESYYNARTGKYGLINLSNRYGDIQLPDIQFSDLKVPTREGTMKGHLSPHLFNEMQKVLYNNQQVILFQNRRGYAPFIECNSCGWVPQCDHCDISLTYHQVLQKLVCHYCGHKVKLPPHCPSCGNAGLSMKSFGTEKIEDELPLFFPKTGVIRVDQDTTRGKNAFEKFFREFEKGEKQIMVGTQMITKGLDFENVKLVGILLADLLLFFPDFRGRERAYQLMAQVSGRPGRIKEQGKVVIQTFHPGHPLFTFLKTNDYESFFEYECRERQQFNYPPYCKLIRIILKHPDRKKVQEGALLMANLLKKKKGMEVLGPEFPPVSRIRNQYINEILIKSGKNSQIHAQIRQHIRKCTDELANHKLLKKVKVTADVDPY